MHKLQQPPKVKIKPLPNPAAQKTNTKEPLNEFSFFKTLEDFFFSPNQPKNEIQTTFILKNAKDFFLSFLSFFKEFKDYLPSVPKLDSNIITKLLQQRNKNIKNALHIGSNKSSIELLKKSLKESQIYVMNSQAMSSHNQDNVKYIALENNGLVGYKETQKRFNLPPFDIIIIDGKNSVADNLNSLIYSIKHLQPKGHIIIENIYDPFNIWRILSFVLNATKKFDSVYAKTENYSLFIEKK